jgi:four helix bundle protein
MARDHTKLRIFTVADKLVLEVYEITRLLPPEERFGLQSQLRRAAVSAPTNIVEGSVRRSDRHYLRYLEISLGSACEARYLLGLCVNLKLLDAKACDRLVASYTEMIKGLAALITRVENDLAAKRQARRAASL